jgi:hypothetical protein
LYNVKGYKEGRRLEYSLLVKHLPTMFRALGSIPSTGREERTEEERKEGKGRRDRGEERRIQTLKEGRGDIYLLVDIHRDPFHMSIPYLVSKETRRSCSKRFQLQQREVSDSLEESPKTVSPESLSVQMSALHLPQQDSSFFFFLVNINFFIMVSLLLNLINSYVSCKVLNK